MEIFLASWLMHVLLLVCTAEDLATSTFDRKTFCDVTNKQSAGCVQEVPNSRHFGNLRCAAKCEMSETCVGALVSSEACFVVDGSCSALTGTCGPGDADFVYFGKNSGESDSVNTCNNGGVLDTDSYLCSCTDGWIGDMCDQRARKCQELYEDGYSFSRHVVTLDPYGDGSVLLHQVDCQVKMYSRMYIFSSKGSGNYYNRSWNDFVYGERLDDNNFWLGLNKAYHLVQAGNVNIRLSFEFRIDGNLVPARYDYNDFSISDEDTGFILDYVSSEAAQADEAVNASIYYGDCLDESKGRPFSAPLDVPASGGSADFAVQSGTGWWFPDDPDHVTCSPLGWSPQHVRSKVEEYIRFTGLNMTSYSDKFENVFMYFKRA